MRIAYLCCDFGVPVAGTVGCSIHVQETVRALRAMGHSVELYAPGAAGDPSGAMPLSGTVGDVVRLMAEESADTPWNHVIGEVRTLLYSECLREELMRAAAFRPDVIYERYALFSYAGLELARELGVPFLLEANAPLVDEQVRYRKLTLRRTAGELERRVLSGADAVIVISRAMERYVRGVGVPRERIVLLPNGADPARFRPGVSGEAVRRRHRLVGKRVIGFVGSLRPWHDLGTLVSAARLLHRRDPDVRLLIVGDGRLTGTLLPAERHVAWAGAVPHDEVPAHMAAMDVVVVPYVQAPEQYFSPLKLYEAMAMAKPIVGARIGQVEEVLDDGESGLLYEPGDAHDLAERIASILTAPDGGMRMAAAARARVDGSRTWEQNARRIVELSQALIGMPAAP
ncbi:glycosyltransferase family 4 protein [Candidatus Solirubrobacter pratensis]|uniref:glycosyltransferase family 4 protein n=1 Tax=Candidatus Solirubrobacter pratensis TaxID=1298857 RepID=UPI00041D528D|nr:glycosyltransferase family 4 protein [Candidatus Solirubrobacter pratensis]